MPSIYNLKPAFQNLLRPLARWLAGVGVTANHVTMGALFLSLGSGYLLYIFPEKRWPLLLLPVVLFVRMGLNAIDGMLAREFNMKSALGAILNEMGDVLSDVFLYLPFVVYPFTHKGVIVIFVLMAVFVEMIGIMGIQIGGSRRYDGPFGKSDRAFVLGLLGLLLGLGAPVNLYITPLFIIMIVLSTVTIFNRANKALQEVKE